jgi:hypothetical protein
MASRYVKGESEVLITEEWCSVASIGNQIVQCVDMSRNIHRKEMIPEIVKEN